MLENILDILKQGMGPMMAGTEKDVRGGSETGGSQNFKSFEREKGDGKRVIGGYRTGYRWVLVIQIQMFFMFGG